MPSYGRSNATIRLCTCRCGLLRCRAAPDWAAIYRGYASAVDWPTAGFFRELNASLSYGEVRAHAPESGELDPELFGDNLQADHGRGAVPPEMRPFVDMADWCHRQDRFSQRPGRGGVGACLRCAQRRGQGDDPRGSAVGLPGEGRLGTALRVPRHGGACGAVPSHQQSHRVLGQACRRDVKRKSASPRVAIGDGRDAQEDEHAAGDQARRQ